jgi:hypothetical protein
MEKPIVVDKKGVMRSRAIWFGFGVVFGAGLLSMFIRYAEHRFDQQMLQEAAIVKACRLPQVDGAMTVFTRLDGKPVCWEWK